MHQPDPVFKPATSPQPARSGQSVFLLFVLGACLQGAVAAPSPVLQLRPAAQVTGQGAFVSDLIEGGIDLPALRVADAPAFGQAAVVSRDVVLAALREGGVELAPTNLVGAPAARITRKARALGETDLLQLLTPVLQEQCAKDRGELELRFTRPWTAVPVPDEPLTLKVLEAPHAGLSPSFILRFQLETSAGERVGSWQAVLQARLWREVWVVRSPVKRGQPLTDADLARERRDVLPCREPLAEIAPGDATLEIADPVPAGAPLLARCVKARPVVRKGQTLPALLEDGALAISLKVEIMEDGAPGQIIRARNPLSRRDLRCKVVDDQTLRIAL